MRAAVTALAPMSVIAPLPVEATVADAPPRRAASHYLWAMLLMELLAIRLGYQKTIAKSLVMARIYEALPLVCPICQAQMRIISFINDADTVRKILITSANQRCRRESPARAGLRCGRPQELRNKRATTL